MRPPTTASPGRQYCPTGLLAPPYPPSPVLVACPGAPIVLSACCCCCCCWNSWAPARCHPDPDKIWLVVACCLAGSSAVAEKALCAGPPTPQLLPVDTAASPAGAANSRARHQDTAQHEMHYHNNSPKRSDCSHCASKPRYCWHVTA